MESKVMSSKFIVGLFGLTVGIAQAVCPSAPSSQRFLLQGAEVFDQKTGLVWARCSVGQNWDGSHCSGSATGFTHESAFAYAYSQNGWRLPNVKELASLVDRGCRAPAIDSAVFPAVTSYWYWTSTAYAGVSDNAWFVRFSDGLVDANLRTGEYAVRLVRTN